MRDQIIVIPTTHQKFINYYVHYSRQNSFGSVLINPKKENRLRVSYAIITRFQMRYK
jgi:hypothetical protein